MHDVQQLQSAVSRQCAGLLLWYALLGESLFCIAVQDVVRMALFAGQVDTTRNVGALGLVYAPFDGGGSCVVFHGDVRQVSQHCGEQQFRCIGPVQLVHVVCCGSCASGSGRATIPAVGGNVVTSAVARSCSSSQLPHWGRAISSSGMVPVRLAQLA